MKRTISAALFASSLLVFASLASAQGIPTSIGGLELSVSSNNPVPGQTVRIEARSYTFDINAASLTWTADGKTLAKGVGATTVSVKAPALGKRLTVNVTAVTSSGMTVNNSVTISSGSVDLIIESDGYVPPLFSGKAPVAYQNKVKIVAVPHLANTSGVEYDPKTLVYKWQQNDKVLESESGYGKQSVTIAGGLVPRPYNVTVTVSTRDGSAQGAATMAVTAGSPTVVMYRDDPLYGPLFNNAVGSTLYLGSVREVNVLAVPYGFNTLASGLDGLTLTWLINGAEHPELATNDSVTLRAPEGTSGSSNVEPRVNGAKNILQQGGAAFSAIFSDSAAGGVKSTAQF